MLIKLSFDQIPHSKIVKLGEKNAIWHTSEKQADNPAYLPICAGRGLTVVRTVSSQQQGFCDLYIYALASTQPGCAKQSSLQGKAAGRFSSGLLKGSLGEQLTHLMRL